jgi:hypothetical protein
MGFGVWEAGFRAQDVGGSVWDLRFRFQVLGFRV